MRVGPAVVVVAAAALVGSSPAQAAHGPTYRGQYTNAQVAGRTANGTPVSIMAGTHDDFPYHDPGSDFGQIAVQVGFAEPVVVTGRPRLPGIEVRPGERSVRLAYAAREAAFDLELAAVRHTPRFEGDPAQLGDLFLRLGLEPGDSPGLVYTPYELTGLTRGTLRVGRRTLRLASLHGQAEAGWVNAPTDSRFHTAYDYLAAPSVDPERPYAYVGFKTRALHASSELDGYFRDTASDEFTMQERSLRDGNEHGVPAPFPNTRALPAGALTLAQWATDLGPGTLYRKLVLARDRAGRPLLALSETIEDDAGRAPDSAPPVISRARMRAGRGGRRVSFRLSEPALVSVRTRRRWLRLRVQGHVGPNAVSIRGAWRSLTLRATDQAGNRSRPVRLLRRSRS